MVSFDAALLLAGVLPLDIRIRVNASLYEARRGVSRLVGDDIEIEQKMPYAERPHQSEHVRRRLAKIASNEDLAEPADGTV